MSSPVQPGSPVNVGDILAGKYQVERVLGVGGMGVVVAAKHLTLGERVAIKFLLPQALAREDVVIRFRREGQAAARLRSEHVTRVHDVGQLESGAPFLVMEYLDGTDLGAVIRDKGPLAIEPAVEYVMQACEALAEAHALGIIHRDLKPSNLFLIKRLDGSPSVKLIDFGISKVSLPGAEGAEGEMTATAVMMGSPLYMAPEQMASARDVDGRADIWSLGIILHATLTGAPPFRAPTVMGVYELIVQGAPPIRKQRPEVPEGLEAVILKCLQKDRRQRYANVGELAEALAPFGPPEARAQAERIKRIMAARQSTGSIPPPPDAPVPVAAITPATPQPSAPEAKSEAKKQAEAADGTPSPSASASSPSSPSGSLSQSSAALDPHTGGPWDQRTQPPTSRKRPVALVAAVAALVIGAPLAFFALRSTSGPRVAPGADPSGAPAVTASASASASAAPDPAQPSVLPGPAARPPSDPPAPTATASAAPSVLPTATARNNRTPPPVAPKPSSRPRSAEDLFGTQK
jgi:serine/threonine-protein kinase